MNIKKLIIAVVGVGILASAVLFWRFRMQPTQSAAIIGENANADANREESGEFSGGNTIESLSQVLVEVPSHVDCSKASEIKSRFGEDADSFWQDPKSPNKPNLVFFDKKDRALTVCLNGRAIAARFPEFMGDLEEHEEMVRLADANLSDMNDDRKPEFIVYNGQCVEGPCIGNHYLIQVDGEKLKALYALRSEQVSLLKEMNQTPQALSMQKYCYTYEFGIAFSTFDVAEFDSNGTLKLLARREIAGKYPKVIAEIKRQGDVGDSISPEQRAYGQIQDLILDAYSGASKQQVLSSYEKALSTLPKRELEVALDDRLPVHCNARKILESIAR